MNISNISECRTLVRKTENKIMLTVKTRRRAAKPSACSIEGINSERVRVPAPFISSLFREVDVNALSADSILAQQGAERRGEPFADFRVQPSDTHDDNECRRSQKVAAE